jgi:hypothetical protein
MTDGYTSLQELEDRLPGADGMTMRERMRPAPGCPHEYVPCERCARCLNCSLHVHDPEPAGRRPWRPNWCVAPSAMLAEWVTQNGYTGQWLAATASARNLGLVREVLRRQPFGAEHAAVLEAATGVPAGFWLGAEDDYRSGLAAGLPDVTDA